MRIDRVVARAFGPFRGEELRLAPGMTVVAGPNEAGKSSWHAAIRLALTGLRRGKGPGTVAERQLAERHRPWDGDERWEVEARLELADGRLIELRQDLANKVDCRAVDIGLGRDVSSEILDGTPDASRWLGLNRDTFAATVSVSQAQILAVTEAADELQEQMQRAAATHGAEGTAAEAIDRLEQFRRDAVGADRIGARGPLRTARDRITDAEGKLAEARRQHQEYLERSAAVDAVEERVAVARSGLQRAEARLLAVRAAEARGRYVSAAELAAQYPTPPVPSVARDERADAVAAALDGWATRPAPIVLSGPSAADLEAELVELPPMPQGDREPHPSVREALRALELAEGAMDALADEPAPGDGGLPQVEEGRVRELARRLRAPQLPGIAGLEDELRAAQASAAATVSPIPRLAFGIAALLALGGGVTLLAGAPALAGLMCALALVAVGVGWWAGAATRRAAERVTRAEAALAPYLAARFSAEEDRQQARREARAAGLPEDPVQLDDLADRLAGMAATRRAAEIAAARRESQATRRDAARRALAVALSERGHAVGDDPVVDWTAYEEGCRLRGVQAQAAARREPLERQLDARRAAERSASAAAAAIETAARRLVDAAAAVGLDATGAPDDVVARLRDWQAERAARLSADEAAAAGWQRLEVLLGGRTLDQLQHEAEIAERRAAEAAEGLDVVASAPDEPPAQLEARLGALRAAVASASSEADALHGNLEARRERLPDVAEAEEAVLAAEVELRRVQQLAETIDRTIGLLRSAEERVHRSLAPVLAATIGRWLPLVSGGAYVEISVDPADLSVRAKEEASGKWRDARLLSEGTREQIYLLLRVAMAEHLVTNGETAPLLLDEVTVQSDADRKRQLLDVLHRISAERQVILFTHDDDVLAWADANLAATRDAVVRLPAVAVGAPVSIAAVPAGELEPVPLAD